MIRNTITFCLLLTSVLVSAQSSQRTISYNKTERSVVMVELPYGADLIKEAIHEHLVGKGKAKGKEIKGFAAYKNPNPQVTDSMNANLYFRVESNGRKEKDGSIVYLLVSHQGKGEMETTELHHLNVEESKQFLNQLVPVIDAYVLNDMISEQTDEVKKAAKKYNELIEEGKDLEKKKASIEKSMISNQQDQDAQSAEVELQKQKLASLLLRKKS